MKQTPDLTQPATTQLGWLHRGEITSVGLLDAYAQRYRELNPSLNAIVAVDLEGARRQATEIDRRRAAGEALGPLAGLPMTVKDVFDVDGLPAVSGSPKLATRPPSVADAVVVERLRRAGAVIWGKTNTPFMAGDLQTYNKVYGVTNNPHDTARTPGGSSGGAAAALASCMTPLEVGSDIGGSLRTPSHNCGVFALKPTHGVIPLQGHVPPSPGVNAPPPDLAVAGPMARNMGDLALLFSVLADRPRSDSNVGELAGLRVARWDEPNFALGQEVRSALDGVVERLQDRVDSITVSSPNVEASDLIDVYQRLLFPIITAEVPAVARRMLRLGRPLARRVAKPGRFSAASGLAAASQSADEIAEAQHQRATFKHACDAFFDDFDVLIAPVTAVPAIPHDTTKSMGRRRLVVDGATVPYTSLLQWISLASTCHLPAVSIPVEVTPAGLPIGIQIMGREGHDHELMDIAQLLVDQIGTPTNRV